MATANQTMNIARKQIGYTEGKNNDTKYEKAFGLNHQSWCAIFCWWCGQKAAEKHKTLNPIAKNASAAWIQDETVRRGGRWILKKTTSAKKKKAVLDDLREGDIISFDFGTKDAYRDHVGFVEKVSGDNVITIEGNTQPDKKSERGSFDKVCRKKRHYTDMCAVVRPKYTKK